MKYIGKKQELVISLLIYGFEILFVSLFCSVEDSGWYEHCNVRRERMEFFAAQLYPGTYRAR